MQEERDFSTFKVEWFLPQRNLDDGNSHDATTNAGRPMTRKSGPPVSQRKRVEQNIG